MTTHAPLLHSPEGAAERLQCGRTLIYELLASGEIESVKIGRLRRIPDESLIAYVNKLRSRQPASGGGEQAA